MELAERSFSSSISIFSDISLLYTGWAGICRLILSREEIQNPDSKDNQLFLTPLLKKQSDHIHPNEKNDENETEADEKTESHNAGEIRKDFKFIKMFKYSKVKREA